MLPLNDAPASARRYHKGLSTRQPFVVLDLRASPRLVFAFTLRNALADPPNPVAKSCRDNEYCQNAAQDYPGPRILRAAPVHSAAVQVRRGAG